MGTRLTLAPGQNGTRKLVTQYGESLVCVRHRYDARLKVRHKTIEPIGETAPWVPRARNAPRAPEDVVHVRIGYGKAQLRERIKAAGAIWRPRHKLWEVDWKTARELGLQSRVVVETGNWILYAFRYARADAYIRLCVVAYTNVWG